MIAAIEGCELVCIIKEIDSGRYTVRAAADAGQDSDDSRNSEDSMFEDHAGAG